MDWEALVCSPESSETFARDVWHSGSLGASSSHSKDGVGPHGIFWGGVSISSASRCLFEKRSRKVKRDSRRCRRSSGVPLWYHPTWSALQFCVGGKPDRHLRDTRNRGADCTTSDRGYQECESVDAANSLVVTIADYLDEMVEMNGWRDHYQIKEGASNLYPGSGRPAVGFYWFSAVCYAIKDHLEVIPPIFNHCMEVLTAERETEARDAYWNVVMHETSLSIDEQIALLYTSMRQNPFISEPHVMLSQLFYRQ